MPEDPPTLGEIMRRLDTITGQLSEIVREIRQDRIDAAKTYVRQDVLHRAEQVTNAHIADIRADVTAVDTKIESDRKQYQTDRKADAATRRQMWLGIGTIGATLIIGIGGLLLSILTLLR